MPRKKSANPEKLLSRVLRIRLTESAFERLDKISKNSDTRTIGEVARKILSKEHITVFYRDTTLNGAMEELAMIRKELRAIGVNINQVTKAFHSDKSETIQIFQVAKLVKIYIAVEMKTERIFKVVNKLNEKWLPKS